VRDIVISAATAFCLAACGSGANSSSGSSSGWSSAGTRNPGSGASGSSGSGTATSGSGESGTATSGNAQSGSSSGAASAGSSATSGASTSGAASSGTATSGGAIDGGGGTDASHDAPLACFQDGGALVPTAKICYTDGECTVLVVHTCCGADLAIGLSKVVPQYAACYPQAGPNSCGRLGCAKFLGTLTEDDQVGTSEPVAQCVSGAQYGQCMTRHGPLDSGVDGG
jgi:hypothetical protein